MGGGGGGVGEKKEHFLPLTKATLARPSHSGERTTLLDVLRLIDNLLVCSLEKQFQNVVCKQWKLIKLGRVN